MPQKKCYLCDGSDHQKREGKIRNLEGTDVLECKTCSLVFLSSFAHIDNEFYKKGEMHLGANVKTLLAMTQTDDTRRFKFLKNKISGKKILDFGSGDAGFLIRAKDAAYDILGLEIDETFREHYQQNEIPMITDLSQTDEKFDLITMFHVLEHLPNPKEILKEIAPKMNKDAELVIEVPSSEDALITVYKNKGFKNFTYWGCHLFLFNEKTLKKLFEDSDFKINSIRHVQRYGLANHLHWILTNKPNGHNRWKFLNFKPFNKVYETILSFFKITDTIIVNVSPK